MWSLESMKVGGRGQSGKTLEANLSASFSRTIFLVPENPRSNLSSPCFVLLFLYFLISVCSPSGVRPLRTEKERNEIIFFQRALPWETGGGGWGAGGSGFHCGHARAYHWELGQPSHLESASPKVRSDFANPTQTSDGKWAGP